MPLLVGGSEHVDVGVEADFPVSGTASGYRVRGESDCPLIAA